MFTQSRLLFCLAFAVILAGCGDELARSQVGEVLSQTGIAKVSVSEYYIVNGHWPVTNADARLGDMDNASNKYLASVNVAGGSIVATIKTTDVAAAIAGKTITLTPVITSDAIKWRCSSTIEDKLLPEECQINKERAASTSEEDALSQLSEVHNQLYDVKRIVYEYHTRKGEWPATTADAVLPDVAKISPYLASVEVTDGIIEATLKSTGVSYNIAAQTVTLTPYAPSVGVIQWKCTSSADSQYLPKDCQHEPSSAATTDPQVREALTQFGEVLVQMGNAKTRVTEYYALNGKWPLSNADIKLAGANEITGKYVANLNVDNGKVVAGLQTTGVAVGIAGQTITLTPSMTNGGWVEWQCTSTADDKYVPPDCRQERAPSPESGTDTQPLDAHAQMIQVVTQMAGAKAGVTEYYASNGTWPRNNADIGLGDAMDISGKYMASLEVADGEVIASLQTTGVAPAIAGQIVTLTPSLIDGGSGGIAWKCSTTANAKYLPSGCFIVSDTGLHSDAELHVSWLISFGFLLFLAGLIALLCRNKFARWMRAIFH